MVNTYSREVSPFGDGYSWKPRMASGALGEQSLGRGNDTDERKGNSYPFAGWGHMLHMWTNRGHISRQCPSQQTALSPVPGTPVKTENMWCTICKMNNHTTEKCRFNNNNNNNMTGTSQVRGNSRRLNTNVNQTTMYNGNSNSTNTSNNSNSGWNANNNSP